MAASRHLGALSGLRFFAAAHVVFYHYLDGAALSGLPLESALRAIVEKGSSAVSLFYVLSGFVLVHAYGGAPDGQVDRRGFWVARVARVVPVYLLALGVAAWLVSGSRLMEGSEGMAALIASVFLVQSFYPPWVILWNVPGWSVSVEAFFYAVFPFVLPRMWRLPRARLFAVIALCWFGAMLPPIVYLLVQPDAGVPPDGPVPAPVLMWVKFFPPLRLAEFVLGMATGLLFRSDVNAGLVRSSWLAPGAALAIVAALALPLPFPLMHNGVLAPLIAALVLGLAHGGGPLGRLLATRPLAELGEASYSLYILQRPVRLIFLVAIGGSSFATTSPREFAAYFAVLTVVSLAVYRGFEVPSRRAIRSWGARAPQPSPHP